MEERLEKIEGKLALNEDLLDELNKLVYKQQRQIEQLQRAVVRMQEQIESAPLTERRSLMDEIPPHY
jgi:SlyX protein